MSGENLVNAALIIDKAGQEIDAMLEEFFGIIQKHLELKDDIRKVEFFNEDEDESSEWICKGTLQNFGIFKKGGKKANAFLAIQVKLCDEREEEIVGKQPLLYVLFSPEGKWEYEEFLLCNAIAGNWELTSNSLWENSDKDENRSSVRAWDQSEWVFIVPLLSINTPDDLTNFIVNPVKDLIDGKPVNEVFAEHDRILRFSVDGTGIKVMNS